LPSGDQGVHQGKQSGVSGSRSRRTKLDRGKEEKKKTTRCLPKGGPFTGKKEPSELLEETEVIIWGKRIQGRPLGKACLALERRGGIFVGLENRSRLFYRKKKKGVKSGTSVKYGWGRCWTL